MERSSSSTEESRSGHILKLRTLLNNASTYMVCCCRPSSSNKVFHFVDHVVLHDWATQISYILLWFSWICFLFSSGFIERNCSGWWTLKKMLHLTRTSWLHKKKWSWDCIFWSIFWITLIALYSNRDHGCTRVSVDLRSKVCLPSHLKWHSHSYWKYTSFEWRKSFSAL